MVNADVGIVIVTYNAKVSGVLTVRWSDWLSDLCTGGYMTDKEKLMGIKKAIRDIIAYPKKGESRRTRDGYPPEVVYDDFAYKRIVRAYRDGLRQVLRDYR